MALKYYHAEPMANSLKSMIPLKEKGLAYESVYVDLHKFEQHSDWFTAINPEGQVPVLDHDGAIVTHTTVINEYLEDVFPDDQPASGPLRPKDALGAARMRYWNKFVDEHVMNHVSMHGWHRMVGVIARNIEDGTFEELLAHIPLPDQRKKWPRRARAFPRRTCRTRARRSTTRWPRSKGSSAKRRGWPATPTPWPTSISIRTAARWSTGCSRKRRSTRTTRDSQNGASG